MTSGYSIVIMTRAIRTHLSAGFKLGIGLYTFYSCGRNSRVAKLSRNPFMNAMTFQPLFVDLFQAHNKRWIQGDRSNWINHFQNLYASVLAIVWKRYFEWMNGEKKDSHPWLISPRPLRSESLSSFWRWYYGLIAPSQGFSFDTVI